MLLLLYIIQPIAYAQDSVISLSNASQSSDYRVEKDTYESIYSKENICKRIYGQRNFNKVDRDKSGKISAQLGGFQIRDNTLYYKVKIENRSNINYDIDFIRFYVRDLETAKRTVTQERELETVHSYGTGNNTVEGQHSEQYVFALDKFPITKDKALIMEVYEKNGGRHLYLKAKQSDIENASAIE
ncbi:DUF4138 domain-containing protein [Albibacterium bauzanense]|uniref:DUF4138 domain-containing protein n=1 Tax=Albibacterium bauzanense TaxID=653929 RepID=UPI001404FB68|nr:DUF4138 domain-containing protein [Albibacterium bauzanense]